MVSYADMITIIMAFFVVLYASTAASGTRDRGGKAGQEPQGGREVTLGKDIVDDPLLRNVDDAEPRRTPDRMQRVLDSLYLRFGPEWTVSNCWSGGPPGLRPQRLHGGEPEPPEPSNRPPARNPAGAAGQRNVIFYVPRPNDTLVTGGRIFFAEDSAELSPEQKQVLSNLAWQLAGKVQKIEIRGHTSRKPLPAGTPFRDHLDLAYSRCRAVRSYLITLGIDPRRMRISEAGENEPLDVTGDPSRLGESSRVDIHWLNEWVRESPTPAAAGEEKKSRTDG